MAAVIGSLRAELSASIAKFQSDMGRAADSVKSIAKEFTAVGNDFKKTGAQMQSVGTALSKTLTLPLVALGGAAAKVGIDFESAFAGVRKTVDGVVDNLGQLTPIGKQLEQGFRDLAKVIPVSVNELAKLGETAGALGIPRDAVLDFAKVMAQLGVTTNLTSDQAATAIAKIQNIFGAAGKDTQRFASTLVALGNDGASTEAEIVSMAERIAGAGHVVGLTQGQVLAFSSALASVGIEAEAGGTAMSKVFVKLAEATASGGKKLEDFAKVAGQSAGQFAQAFSTDAAGATTAFVEGLGKIQKAGGNLFEVLQGLDITEVRTRDALLRAAGAGDLLRHALELQSKAWTENSALTKEAEQRFRTTESQLTLLWNRIKDVGITLFTALKPAIDSALSAMNDLLPIVQSMAKAFGSLPGGVQLGIFGVAAFAAALGPVLFIGGQVVSSLGTLALAFGKTGIATRALLGAFQLLSGTTTIAATASLGSMAAALGPIAIAAAAAGAALYIFNQRMHALEASGQSTGKPLKALEDGMSNTRLTIDELQQKMKELNGTLPELSDNLKIGGITFKQFGGVTVTNTTATLKSFSEQVKEAVKELDNTKDPVKDAAKAIIKYRDEVDDLRKSLSGGAAIADLKKLADAFRGLPSAMHGNDEVLRRTAEAFEKLGDDLELNKLPADLKTFAERMHAVTVESAAAANAATVLARAGDHVGQVFGVFLITLEQMRNLAKGLTHDGLVPMAAGFDDAARSALAAEVALEAIRKSREALQKALASPIGLMPDLSGAAKNNMADALSHTKQEAVGLSSVLGSLSNDFVQLSQIGSGSLGHVVKDIGLAVKAGEALDRALRLSGIGGDAGTAVAGADVKGAGAGLGAAVGSASALSAISASSAATIVGAWVAVGIAVYSFVSALRAANEEAEKLEAFDKAVAHVVVGFESMTKFSEQLGHSIDDNFQAFAHMTALNTKFLPTEGVGLTKGSGALAITLRDLAEAASLTDIIKELGGISALTAGQLATVRDRARDLFILIDLGGPVGQKAIQTLDSTLVTFTQTLSKSSGLVDKFFLDMAAQARAAGVELAGVEKFISDQITTNVVGGLQAFTAPAAAASVAFAKIKDQMSAIADERDRLSESRSLGTADSQRLEALNKQWADLSEQAKTQATIISALTIQSQGAADALAGTVAAAFGEMQQAGIPIIDIVNQLEPITAQLQKQFSEAGLSGGAAFERIQAFGVLAKDEIAGPVINAVIGLGKSLTGLHNVGLLNQETFSGLTSQISTSFAALQITGHGGADALALLQQPLQTIWALSNKFGLAVDEGTQALLDQAIAAGLVGEKQKPIQEQMLDATNRIADALDELVKGFGFLAPAAKVAADGIQTALNNIHAPTLTVPVNFVAGSGVTGPDGVEISPENSFASGSQGLRNFGSGTLAMLHGTEGVFTPAQLAEIQASGSSVSSQARLETLLARSNATMERMARYLTMDQANVLATAVRDEVVKVKAYR